MADISSDCVVYEQDMGPTKPENSNAEFKEIIVETPQTADSGDTIDVDLSNYGISTPKIIRGWEHTSPFSVITVEDPTTSVSGTTITITIGGSSDDNEVRTYLVGGI